MDVPYISIPGEAVPPSFPVPRGVGCSRMGLRWITAALPAGPLMAPLSPQAQPPGAMFIPLLPWPSVRGTWNLCFYRTYPVILTNSFPKTPQKPHLNATKSLFCYVRAISRPVLPWNHPRQIPRAPPTVQPACPCHQYRPSRRPSPA